MIVIVSVQLDDTSLRSVAASQLDLVLIVALERVCSQIGRDR